MDINQHRCVLLLVCVCGACRWNAGPMQVMKKCLVNTWKSDRIPLTSKLSVTYFFWRSVNQAGLCVYASRAGSVTGLFL
jgi:hypothetical protein